jgi:hypothetical protein
MVEVYPVTPEILNSLNDIPYREGKVLLYLKAVLIKPDSQIGKTVENSPDFFILGESQEIQDFLNINIKKTFEEYNEQRNS